MRRVLLCLALCIAGPLFANSKSLFINGVYAATYGDLSWDKGDWQGNNYSAIRLKAGFQLLRLDFVGLTIGFQKVGFYDGIQKWSGDKKIAFDYRGPVLELHLFPDAPFGFSLAGMSGSGYSYLTSPEYYRANCTIPACKIDAERSSLKVGEVTAYVTAKISYGLQAVLGTGTRSVHGSPKYDIDRNRDHTWETGTKPDWKESHSFFLLGLRGTTL